MITRKATTPFIEVGDLASYLGLSEYLATLHAIDIESCIERATVSVENAYNISLREMELSLSLNYAEGYCPLYHHPVTEVLTEGIVFDGMGVTLTGLHRSFVVDYKTGAVADAAMYRATVLSLASKLYNDEQG